MLVSMLVASDDATAGSVIRKAERISPSISGRSHFFLCSLEPYRINTSMLPVSGAEQLNTSETAGEDAAHRRDGGGGGDPPHALAELGFDGVEQAVHLAGAAVQGRQVLGGDAVERRSAADADLGAGAQVLDAGHDGQLAGAVLGGGELGLQALEAGLEALVDLVEARVLFAQAAHLGRADR